MNKIEQGNLAGLPKEGNCKDQDRVNSEEAEHLTPEEKQEATRRWASIFRGRLKVFPSKNAGRLEHE